MGSKFKSDFLVASPSMASGAARLLDWYGNFDEYNISRNEKEADLIATAADWNIVGDDIQRALDQFEVSNQSK
jgi:hypothetical protein